jgi:hypothetical protein
MGKGGSAPPPPDYRGAAKETAAGDLEAARTNALANRVNQVTPYGNLTYSQTPTQALDAGSYQSAIDNWKASGSQGAAPNPADFMKFNADAGWTATQTLSPEQQKLLDYQNQTSIGLGELTGTGLNYVKGMLQDPFTTKNLPSLGFDAGQTYQDAYMARLNPQILQGREQMAQRLANQGITVGSKAYEEAMRLQGQKENDMLLGATTQGFGTGLSARQQGFNESAYQRNEPLNTLNAVRTGAQVTNPSYVSVPQQAVTRGADMLGATTAEGNYNTASANASAAQNAGMTSGLMSLAGTATMAF